MPEPGQQQVAAVKANALHAEEAFKEVRDLVARGCGLVPAGVLLRIGGERAGGGNGWALQGAGYVGADGVADLAECLAIAGVDGVEVADTVFGHVRHVGDAPVHAAVVTVIDKAVMDRCVVAQTVSGFEALLRFPCARGRFHAIDVGRGHYLHAADRAAIEIELDVSCHVVG